MANYGIRGETLAPRASETTFPNPPPSPGLLKSTLYATKWPSNASVDEKWFSP